MVTTGHTVRFTLRKVYPQVYLRFTLRFTLRKERGGECTQQMSWPGGLESGGPWAELRLWVTEPGR